MQKTTPLSRSVREFVFVLFASAAFLSFLGSMRAGDIATIKAHVIPLAVAALAALLCALATYVLALWEWYQVRVSGPLERAISTAVKFFAAQIVAVQIVSVDPQVLLTVGTTIWTIVVQSIAAGVTVLIVNTVEGTTAPAVATNGEG